MNAPIKKSLNHYLSFLNLYQHTKISLLHLFIFEMWSVLESLHHSGHTCFWPCSPLIFSIIFKFAQICTRMKNKQTKKTVQSDQSKDQIGQTHNLTYLSQLIFVNLYRHTKNEAALLICSEEIFDLKILQYDSLRALWPISQEQDRIIPNIGFVQKHSKE